MTIFLRLCSHYLLHPHRRSVHIVCSIRPHHPLRPYCPLRPHHLPRPHHGLLHSHQIHVLHKRVWSKQNLHFVLDLILMMTMNWWSVDGCGQWIHENRMEDRYVDANGEERFCPFCSNLQLYAILTFFSLVLCFSLKKKIVVVEFQKN